MPLPPPPEKDPRIGYYTPEGEWIVPKGNIYNKTFGANTTEADAIKTLNNTSLLQLSSLSDPIYGSAWTGPKPKKGDHPKDYYVPDFGLDQDIK